MGLSQDTILAWPCAASNTPVAKLCHHAPYAARLLSVIDHLHGGGRIAEDFYIKLLHPRLMHASCGQNCPSGTGSHRSACLRQGTPQTIVSRAQIVLSC